MYVGENTSHGVSVEPARHERSAIFFVKEPKVLLQVKIIKGAIFIAPFIICVQALLLDNSLSGALCSAGTAGQALISDNKSHSVTSVCYLTIHLLVI